MNPYDLNNDPQFIKFFGRALMNEIPATETDPACDTAEFEERIEAEVERLLESPSELQDVDIDYIMSIYRLCRYVDYDLGMRLNQYMYKLAEKQARESL